ncbi:TVP38/TMEM64 family protein [Methanohalobium sp.]|uniref:TVP38/TMEM64 family protein n=1 Tax=Methanohalobium sp. TaxID=2837493 RepID=UPI0025E97440|nr:VTT domain-containing protein [Methanohalobium sp.]
MLDKWETFNWRYIPLILFTVFLMIFIIFELSGLLTLEDAKNWVLSFDSLAGLVIILMLIIDLVIPVPSSVLMTLAGSLYGFFWGVLIGTLGSLLASITGFCLTRYIRKRKALTFIDESEQKSMNKWFTQWGEGILILSRMVPMLTETMSCFAGLTGISFLRFLVIIIIGTIPVTVYYSYFGSHLHSVSEWSFPLAAGVIIPGILWIFLHKKIKNT